MIKIPSVEVGRADNAFIRPDDWILVTGAAGFIGGVLVERLLRRGYRRVRCLVRASSNLDKLKASLSRYSGQADLDIVTGNLLSSKDCAAAVKGVSLIYHLAAGRGEKSFADAFMNSVVTTRNLLEACRQAGTIKRFVNISSFAVYSNRRKGGAGILDEVNPLEPEPASRGDAYVFAKIKQEEIVKEYGEKWGIPYTIVRPGVVYGPGNEKITGRVGISTFGVFLHLGGSNPIPLTYVENCCEAIVLAGTTEGVSGEAFNVVDDDLPSSRQYLRMHKRLAGTFFSIYLPKVLSYSLCYLWEKYSAWSEGQLPPVYGRRAWHAFWKRTQYSNTKIKERLSWTQIVPTPVAMKSYFEGFQTAKSKHA